MPRKSKSVPPAGRKEGASLREVLEKQMETLRQQVRQKENLQTAKNVTQRRSPDRKGKSARHNRHPAADRSIVQDESPETEQKPVILQHGSIFQTPMALERTAEDKEGQWTWGRDRRCIVDSWDGVLGPYMQSYVGRKWSEIEAETVEGSGRRHHDYAVEDIAKEAYDRLVELELDDLTRIYRFRMESADRLYGFRIQATFNTLWYDPEHKIYPVELQDKGKVRKRQAREESRKRR